MRTQIYRVDANWDPDAGVWFATSDDVPGLATEAESIESLTQKLRIMIPELLEANRLIRDEPAMITFELRSHRQELIRLAS
ncbi:MAG: DUF1902 domain-containing protein [bacterium]|nr:DUF1902 domain-containing protein [bacterium]